MHRRARAVLAVALWGLAPAAWAVEAGTTMYVRAKDARLMKSSAPSAPVLATLQPGDEVQYVAPDERSGWHKVSYQAKKGVLYRSCLSATRPVTELQASVGTTDKRAFQSSGAATKAVSPGAEKYAENKQWTNESTQLSSLEALAKAIPEAEVAKQAKKHGLYAGRGGAK